MSTRRCVVCGGPVAPDAPGRTNGHQTAVGLCCNGCRERHEWAVLQEQEAEQHEEPALDRLKRMRGDQQLPGLEGL